MQIVGPEVGRTEQEPLKCVKADEPEIYSKPKCMMFPGDFRAAKFTGIVRTTTSGLSGAALLNFFERKLVPSILEKMGLPEDMMPEIVPSFGQQATIHPVVASELGLD